MTHPGSFERALSIAVAAHMGQRDKQGEPYILHVMRLILMVPPGEQYRTVAALHDVVEDNPAYGLGTLEADGFSAEVVAAVDALTRAVPGGILRDATYADYIERVAANDLARAVKICDIRDHLARHTEAVDPGGTLRDRYKAAGLRLIMAESLFLEAGGRGA